MAPSQARAASGSLAEEPTLSEVLDRIERRRGGRIGLGQAAEDIAEERTRR